MFSGFVQINSDFFSKHGERASDWLGNVNRSGNNLVVVAGVPTLIVGSVFGFLAVLKTEKILAAKPTIVRGANQIHLINVSDAALVQFGEQFFAPSEIWCDGNTIDFVLS